MIITAQNTFENAVEAMKHGALDYLVKPFGIAEVKALEHGRAAELERAGASLRRLEAVLAGSATRGAGTGLPTRPSRTPWGAAGPPAPARPVSETACRRW